MAARRLMAVFVMWLCALAGVLLYCGAPALATRGHIFDMSFGAQGSGDGQLNEPADVAVNESTHDVYVVDKGNDRVEEFSSTGSYIGQFNGSGTLPGEGSAAPTGQFSAPEGIAVDNSGDALTDPSAGDVYVADTGHNVIDKFTSTGSYVGQLTEGSPGSGLFGLEGVAVDQNGTLWTYQSNKEVDSFSDAEANEFLSSRETQVGGEPGFAVDSESNLYADWNGDDSTNVAAKFTNTGHIIDIEIDPLEPTTGLAVDLSSNDLYVDNTRSIGNEAASVARYSPEGKLIERFGSGDLKNGTGLTIDSSSGAVYVADPTANAVDIFESEPYSPPVLESEWASDVASTSVSLNADVNPRGSSTEYRFEYGSSTAYGSTAPVPDGVLPSGFGVVGIGIHRVELLADTTYHYRVVAHNELGTVDGPDHTFTTQPAGGGGELTLPDGRAWELVSPPNKKGALIEPFGDTSDQIRAGSNGRAMTYLSLGPSVGEGVMGKFTFSQVLSERGPEGWSSQDIDLPTGPAKEGERSSGKITEYRAPYAFFSEDLSLATVEPQPFGTPPLAPGVSERTVYLRNDLDSSFMPLVTPANAQSAGTEFGGGTVSAEQIHVLTATPDLSHVVLESPLALTPTATRNGNKWNLYEWSAGRLQLISILPKNELPASGDEVVLGGEGQIGPTGGVARSVSNDGRRVTWTEGNAWSGGQYNGLYVRDTVEEKTVRVGGTKAVLQTMSSDGSKIFYLENGDLYEFLYATDTSTDITSAYGAGESAAGVKEDIVGASEDGSTVYFVASGALGGSNGPVSGKDNLYAAKEEGGLWTTTYIATLSREDEASWYSPQYVGGVNPALVLPNVSSRVSPDGRYLAFMSNQSLTGYDNRDANSGQPDEEVYLYDAVAGKLVCASCDPTGARPVGVFDSGLGPGGTNGILLVDRRSAWSGEKGTGAHWLAGSLPGWDEMSNGIGTYQPRYLSDSGRLFFDSPDALVPGDTNGLEDVYEYEPPASGETPVSNDCTRGSATFSVRSDGCVNLISSGTSSGESAFFDASENGDDVFFITSSRLTSADYDASYDVYDAHACSTEAPCVALPVSPPPCTSGDSCKAAPSPQPELFGPAPSGTFSGAGNVVEEPKSAVKPKKKIKRKKKSKQKKHTKTKGKKKGSNSRNAKRFRVGRTSRKGGE